MLRLAGCFDAFFNQLPATIFRRVIHIRRFIPLRDSAILREEHLTFL